MSVAHSSKTEIGIHSSSTDFTSTPSLKQFNPTNTFLPDPGKNYVEREGYQTADGDNLEPIVSTEVLDLGDVEIELIGQSGSGAGDGTDSSSLSMPAEDILEAFFGAAVDDATGEGSDAVDAGTGASLVCDAAVTDLAAGNAVLFQTDASVINAREIVSVASDTLTLDRAPTNNQGTSTNCTESTAVYAAKTFALTVATKNHKHIMIDHEIYGLSRNIYRGVLGNLQILFPSGDTVKLVLTGLQSTDNYPDQTVASPAHSAATGGSPIVAADMPFWVGSTLYQAFDLSLDLGLMLAPRRSDGAPNGRWGQVCYNKVPVLSGKFRLGDLTGPNELDATTKETWRGMSSVDIGWQCGRTAGAACYNRMSDARFFLGQVTEEDGQPVVPFTAKGYGLIPYRLHVF